MFWDWKELLLPLQVSQMAFDLAITDPASIEPFFLICSFHILWQSCWRVMFSLWPFVTSFNLLTRYSLFFTTTSVSGHIGSHLLISVRKMKSSGWRCLSQFREQYTVSLSAAIIQGCSCMWHIKLNADAPKHLHCKLSSAGASSVLFTCMCGLWAVQRHKHTLIGTAFLATRPNALLLDPHCHATAATSGTCFTSCIPITVTVKNVVHHCCWRQCKTASNSCNLCGLFLLSTLVCIHWNCSEGGVWLQATPVTFVTCFNCCLP